MRNPLQGQILIIIFLLIGLLYSFKFSIAAGACLWSLHTFMRYYYLLPKKDIKGQHVLITGGGMGIGRELALQLSKFGCRITIAELNFPMAQEVKKELENSGFTNIQVYQCDVSDLNSVEKVFSEAVKNFGDIDILINNAGIGTAKMVQDNDCIRMAITVQINVIAHFFTTKAVLNSMLNRDHGHIVSISSVAGYIPGAGLAEYNASKYGVLGFHEALTAELQMKRSNIQTTCICPGFVDTNMSKGIKGIPGFQKQGIQEVVTRIVNAIRQNEYIVVIPYKLNVFIFLKQILPYPITAALMDYSNKEHYRQIEEARSKYIQKMRIKKQIEDEQY